MRKVACLASFLAVAALAVLSRPAVAQQEAVVRGRVVDASTRQPVAGAAVRVRGTERGTATNSEGVYELRLERTGTVELVAGKIGYRQATRTVRLEPGGTVTANFSLAVTRIQMGELVATVGAEEVERRATGTSVGRIDAAQAVEEGATSSFSDLLNARSEGLTIQRSSGMTGMGSRVRVRGVSSLTQDNNPLIVIDGVRANNNTGFDAFATGGQSTSRFEDLDPQEVQSVQVMKGPTAATLYGSEAAAGVIVVETRSGSAAAEPEFRFRTRQGFVDENNEYPDTFADVTTGFGVTSLDDPRLDQFRAEKNPVTGTVFLVDNPFMDPDSRPFRHGHHQDYAASVRGGTEGFGYYGSTSWTSQQGTFASNNLDRLNARGNFEIRPSDVTTIQLNAGYVSSNLTFPNDNSIASGLGVNGMLGIPIFSFGTDPQEGPGEGICAFDALQGLPAGTTGACDDVNGNFLATFDKLATLDQGETVQRFTGSGSVEIQPWEWWTNRATVGIDESQVRAFQLFPFDPDRPFGDASEGNVTEQRTTGRVLTFDLASTAEYTLTEDISASTSLGAQYFQKMERTTACTGEEFPAAGVSTCDAAIISRGENSLLENNELGGYGRQRFNYRDYLYLTGALRVDDNSALGEQEGVIWSPSVNASAVLSDMPFWGDDGPGPLTTLRVRAAWGKASQSPDQFARDRTFRNAPTIIDGQTVTGVTPADPGNPDLGPERSEEFEAGFDAGFLNGRIGLDFSYFYSETTDLIVPRPVAPSTGFPNVRFVNLGSMENEGIEVNVDARVLDTGPVAWDVRLIHSTSDPVITDLGLDSPIIFPVGAQGGSRAAGSQVFATGVPPGAYISEVVASATRDDDGNITSFTLAPGNLGDGSARRVVGNPNPGNQQSLSTTVSLFDRIRVFSLFDRVGDVDLLNVTRAFRTPFINFPTFSSFSREFAFRQAESSPEEQAMFEQRILAPFVEDGGFIKWREFSVAYELPPSLTDVVGLGLNRVSVTVGGRNLRTWTDFSGLDPEGNVRGSRDDFIRNNFAGIGIPQRWFAAFQVAF